MSFGIIYILENNPRSTVQQTAAKYLGLDIEFIKKQEVENYTDMFKLGKAPALVTTRGFQLTETIAILNYLIEKSSMPELLGTTAEEKARSLKWSCYINSDFLGVCGQYKHSKTDEERTAVKQSMCKHFDYLTEQLSVTKYFGGDRILACDFLIYQILDKVFRQFGEDLSSYTRIYEYLSNMDEILGRK